MNPEQLTTFTAPADDSRILSLFHDWLELYRAAEGMPNTFEGDKEFDAARERLDAIVIDAIEVPAAGAVGVAIQVFLRLQMEDPSLAPLAAAMVARQGDVAPQGVGFGEPDE